MFDFKPFENVKDFIFHHFPSVLSVTPSRFAALCCKYALALTNSNHIHTQVKPPPAITAWNSPTTLSEICWFPSAI